MKKILSAIIIISAALGSHAQELHIKNDKIQRVLQYDGTVWRTTRFLSADGQAALVVQSNSWKLIAEGSSIGHKRIQEFEPVHTTKIRWRVTGSAAQPALKNLALYYY